MNVTIVCDLRSMFGITRDQGTRPTCMAFAASDAHASLRPSWRPLSYEYAFFHAVERGTGHPDNGVTLGSMLETLREDGQPLEIIWPYLLSTPQDLTQWRPPREVGRLFRRASTIKSNSIDNIINWLDAGVPTIMTFCLSEDFFSNWDIHGVIALNRAPDYAIRHAAIAVGYGTRDNKGLILIRNSWGSDWGIDGHAWISEKYLERALLEIAKLTRDLS